MAAKGNGCRGMTDWAGLINTNLDCATATTLDLFTAEAEDFEDDAFWLDLCGGLNGALGVVLPTQDLALDTGAMGCCFLVVVVDKAA